jgi:glycosyltransferase involved in cell wall biosynthesis
LVSRVTEVNHKSKNFPPVIISIVVPVYSGANFLEELVSEIEKLRDRWREANIDLLIGEAVFVLDSPVDNSAKVIQELASDRAWVRVVELSRNFGQHSATVAGILYSSGEWVVTLDEDLQHHPQQIETLLLKACAESADVVYAMPQGSVHGGGYRDLLARSVKRLIASLSGNQFVQSFNSFRLIRGDIARAAASICAQNTYFDVALTWFTQRIFTASMDLFDDRYVSNNRSGYTFSTLVSHAKRLVLTSDFRVLRFTTSLSLLAMLLSMLLGLWVIYSRFFAAQVVEVQGWASIVIIILGLGSVSLFMLGLILEFLHMSILQLQGKPSFFVVNRSSDQKLALEVKKLETLCKSSV